MALLRVLGGFSSFLFRFVCYTFLRWIPGRQATYTAPVLFLLSIASQYVNEEQLRAVEQLVSKQDDQLSPSKQVATIKSVEEEQAAEAASSSSPPDSALKEVKQEDQIASIPGDVKVLTEANPDPREKGAPSYATVAAAHTDEKGHPIPSELEAVREQTHSTGQVDATAPNMLSATSSENGSSGSRRRRKKKLAPSPSFADADSDFLSELDKPTARTARNQLSSLLFGTPSPSRALNTFSIIVNLLLLACVLDAVLSPIFGMEEPNVALVRVGAVTHESVKITARIPPPPEASLEADTQKLSIRSLSQLNASQYHKDLEATKAIKVGAKIAFRPTRPLGKWAVSPQELVATPETDYTATTKLTGLWASTEYEFRLLNSSSPAGSSLQFHSQFAEHLGSFTTFPDPVLASAAVPGAGTHFTFASTSCVKLGFPYTGPWGRKVVKGARYLKEEAERQKIKFMLFLGDFIYADTPYYPGPQLAAYHKRYRQVFASPDVASLISSVPTLAIYDDHEVYNDFSSSETDERFPPANAAFRDYLGLANPDPSVSGQNYYDFRYGDAAFFVWDTRRFRSGNGDEDDESKTMLGEKQKEVFYNWIDKVNSTVTWKFVVSSVPLMTLWSHADDTWAGFQTERDAILDVLQYVPNVIVLSGDRHEFAAASIRTTVTEFSTSPLNQFYLPIRTLSQSNGRGATGEDVLLQYLPDGNTKFSTFEVDTRVANLPKVTVKVFIDGEEAWKVEVRGKPLQLPPAGTAIGSLGKSLWELLNFTKRSWF